MLVYEQTVCTSYIILLMCLMSARAIIHWLPCVLELTVCCVTQPGYGVADSYKWSLVQCMPAYSWMPLVSFNDSVPLTSCTADVPMCSVTACWLAAVGAVAAQGCIGHKAMQKFTHYTVFLD